MPSVSPATAPTSARVGRSGPAGGAGGDASTGGGPATAGGGGRLVDANSGRSRVTVSDRRGIAHNGFPLGSRSRAPGAWALGTPGERSGPAGRIPPSTGSAAGAAKPRGPDGESRAAYR